MNSLKKDYEIMKLKLLLMILSLIGIGTGIFFASLNSDNPLKYLKYSEFSNVSLTVSSDKIQQTAWLGLEVINTPKETAENSGLGGGEGSLSRDTEFTGGHGVLVKKVIPDSPAEKAGIQVGDIIVSLNGRRIRSAREFRNDISGIKVGTQIKMCIVRGTYRTTIYAITSEAPTNFPDERNKISPWLGIKVAEIDSESSEMGNLKDLGKEGGVFVEEVAQGSPAEKVGLLPGDVIMSFNYRKIRSVNEFLTDLSGCMPNDKIRLCIMRGDIRLTLYPVLEKKPEEVSFVRSVI